MSNTNTQLKEVGKADDFSDKDKAVMQLANFKESASYLVKTKFCTGTDANMLRKVYGNIQLKLNQKTFF